jgi:hypothetical protein
MCLSESISWTTLIIGTIINSICITYLLRINNKKVIIPITLILAWQYALLMQIPDALAWRNPDAKYPGKLAYILNTTQPFIFIILVAIALQKMNISLTRLIPAILIGLIYSIFIMIEAYKINDFNIQPLKTCRNLNYRWWDNLPIVLYFLTLILSMLAIPYLGYIVLNIVIFIGSILIAQKIVGNECNPGSLWCWSVAGSGLCMFLYYILFDNK